jgi:MFS family permease
MKLGGDVRAASRAPALALGLLLLAGSVNYVDRIALSIASPLIAHDLRIGPVQTGVLLSAFLWTYALAQAPAGWLADRLGARRLLGGALVLWSAAQAATALAFGAPQLLAARLALGAFEALQWPTGARIVRDRFEGRRRGAATGVFNSASTLGPAIAPPIVTALMLNIGWRGAFAVTGLVGVLVAALWVGLYRDPRPRPVGEAKLASAPLADVLRSPTLWAMMLGNAGSGYLTWFYAAWLPSYLELGRHFSVAETGLAASLPYAFGFLGSLAGGAACDGLAKAGLGELASRKAPIAAGLLGGAAFTALALAASTGLAALAALSAALMFANVATAAIWALAPAAAPERAVASVGALQNMGGLLGGALAPIVTGVTLKASGGFGPAFVIAAVAGLAGAAAYLVGVRRPIQPAKS